jgi:methylmalonyl-CoA mutase
LDDAKKLYSGFDLSDPKTSVSMTINGPAPILLGFFMNAAIDQNCEKYIHANGLAEEVNAKIEGEFEGGSNWPIPPPFFPLGARAQGLLPLSLAMARFTRPVGSNWRIPPPFFSLGA